LFARIPDLVRDGEDVLKIRGAVLVRGRRKAQEHDLRFEHRRLQVPRELDPLLLQVAQEDVFEPRLVDRDLSRTESFHHIRIVVHAEDLVAPLGKAHPGDQPDVAGPNDCDVHPILLVLCQIEHVPTIPHYRNFLNDL